MPTPPKNRIEVDLKLLSDKDTKLLKEIAGDLKTIINSKMVFGTMAQQMTAAAGTAAAMQAPYLSSQEYRQKHSTTDPGKYSRDVASNYDDFLKDKRKTMGDDWATRNAFSPSHKIDDMEFLNLSRYGDFTVQDILKQISYGIGRFGFQQTGEIGADGKPIVEKTNKQAANIAGAFGMAAHGYPFFRSSQKIAARIRSHMSGQMGYGLAVGQPGPGSGLFGTPLLSPAYRTGLENSYQNFKRTWAGFNPNYSSAQASDASNAVASYGYDVGGDRGQFMIDRVAELQRNLGLSGDQSTSLLDPSMRWGTASVKGLVSALTDMGRAAGEAGVNTQQLTLAAQQYGEQAAQQFGGFASDRILTAGRTGTIFQSPELGGQLSTSPVLQNMIIAKKGYYGAAFSHSQGQDTMQALQQYMKPFGGSFDQMGKTLRTGTKAQKDALMSNLIAAQQAGALPAGMTAVQFAQSLMRSDHPGHNLMKSAQAGDLLNLARMQNNHLSNAQLRSLEKDVVGKDWHKFADQEKGKSMNDRLTALNKMFGEHQRTANSRASTRVRISLDPRAAKYMKAAIDDQESKNAHTNSGYVSKAANYAMGEIPTLENSILPGSGFVGGL